MLYIKLSFKPLNVTVPHALDLSPSHAALVKASFTYRSVGTARPSPFCPAKTSDGVGLFTASSASDTQTAYTNPTSLDMIETAMLSTERADVLGVPSLNSGGVVSFFDVIVFFVTVVWTFPRSSLATRKISYDVSSSSRVTVPIVAVLLPS